MSMQKIFSFGVGVDVVGRSRQVMSISVHRTNRLGVGRRCAPEFAIRLSWRGGGRGAECI